MMASSQAEPLRKLISTYAMRAGEELKRGLPALVREANSTGCWRDAASADGKPFASLCEWLNAAPPAGCGLGCTTDAITFDELLAICEKSSPVVARVLAESAGINALSIGPLNRLKLLWNEASAAQQKQFEEWLNFESKRKS